MAFIRKKSKVYPWPVEVKRPSESVPGEFETTKFIGKFARLDRSSLDKFDNEDEFSALSKILVGWEDVNEEDGTAIEFNKTILKEFPNSKIHSITELTEVNKDDEIKNLNISKEK